MDILATRHNLLKVANIPGSRWGLPSKQAPLQRGLPPCTLAHVVAATTAGCWSTHGCCCTDADAGPTCTCSQCFVLEAIRMLAAVSTCKLTKITLVSLGMHADCIPLLSQAARKNTTNVHTNMQACPWVMPLCLAKLDTEKPRKLTRNNAPCFRYLCRALLRSGVSGCTIL